jgi:hypothetical protein
MITRAAGRWEGRGDAGGKMVDVDEDDKDWAGGEDGLGGKD